MAASPSGAAATVGTEAAVTAEVRVVVEAVRRAFLHSSGSLHSRHDSRLAVWMLDIYGQAV